MELTRLASFLPPTPSISKRPTARLATRTRVPQAGRPNRQKRTVAPRRRRNGDLRTREYLTEAEVERLMKAATGNRHGHRDATMILVAYRHGPTCP